MEYYLFLAGLLTGMLIGVLIMERIYNKHSKEMQEVDDDFEKWKVQRRKQFTAELDEIDRKSRNYVIYPPSEEEFKPKEYAIDPTKLMDEIKKKRVFNSVKTNKLLRSDNVKEYTVGVEVDMSNVHDAIGELQKAIKELEVAVADMKVNTVDISKSDIEKYGRNSYEVHHTVRFRGHL